MYRRGAPVGPARTGGCTKRGRTRRIGSPPARLAVRVVAALIIAVLSFIQASSVAAQQGASPVPIPPPTIEAASAVLMEEETGTILFELDGDERRDPASLVKMMTLKLALDAAQGRVGLDDRVAVSEKAWRTPGSRMFIEPRDEVTLLDLIRGIAIVSGNDACVAVAEHVAGSEEAFVRLMNREAERLGLANTRFANAHGLTADGQYMSARDAAEIARGYVRDHPDALRIHSKKEFEYAGITQRNRNGLLWDDPYVDGLKTGHTEKAGYNLVATAGRGGMRLIAVVLGAESTEAREREAAELLDYGFSTFELLRPVSAGDVVASRPVFKGVKNRLDVVAADSVAIVSRRDSASEPERRIELPKTLQAPIESGQTLGRLVVLVGGEEAGGTDLVAAEEVPRAGFFKVAWDSIKLLVLGLLGRR